MTAELHVLDGPFAGKVIAIATGKFLIGREVDCLLRPNSTVVSRHHCVLLKDEFSLRLRDLHSKNGTFVNGREIEGDVILEHGDVINVGELMLRVVVRAADNAASQETLPTSLQQTAIYDGNTTLAPPPQIAQTQQAAGESAAGQQHNELAPEVAGMQTLPYSPPDQNQQFDDSNPRSGQLE